MIFFAVRFIGHSQSEPKIQDKEIKWLFNKEKTHYIKFSILNQLWVRFNESNPGSTVLGDPTPHTYDLGLRRIRFQFFGQVDDHLRFYFQLGQNNFNYLSGQNAQNTGNRKYEFFLHDAVLEYQIIKGSPILYIGGGITLANGLSRFSSPSASTSLAMDVPVFAQITVDHTDIFSRKIALYATGQLSKLKYRLSITDPFPVTSRGSSSPISSYATFAHDKHHKQYQGFFQWNFLETEAHRISSTMTGASLGKKKVLNIETGFITQEKATWSGRAANDPNRRYYNMTAWSVALYYDLPIHLEKRNSITGYIGYFDTDYGNGYLRYNGAMNPTNGTALIHTPEKSYGNTFPMFGTGHVVYTQVGYLFRKNLLGKNAGTLLPYTTLQRAQYDRLNKPMILWHTGINWLINGHKQKLSLDWQWRPVYKINETGTLTRQPNRKNQIVLGYQFSI